MRDYFGFEGFQLLLEKDVFKDKIVTIGASISELHDNFPTPFFVSGGRILTPGVEIHSNFIQSVLDQNFIAAVPDYYVYLITLIFTIALAFIIKRTKPVIGIASAIGMAAVYSIVNILLFARFQVCFPALSTH